MLWSVIKIYPKKFHNSAKHFSHTYLQLIQFSEVFVWKHLAVIYATKTSAHKYFRFSFITFCRIPQLSGPSFKATRSAIILIRITFSHQARILDCDTNPPVNQSKIE